MPHYLDNLYSFPLLFFPRVSPTLAKLRAIPNRRYNPWPKGKRQPLTKKLATSFFDLLSSSDCSMVQLLRDHPNLPNFKTLDSWRHRYPWFAEAWKQARKAQADFLVQKCLDLAKSTTAKTAHETRVKFDIYRFIAAKFHPDLYGDKPTQAQSTTLNVGISISPERLQDLRAKLDSTRLHFASPKLLTATDGTQEVSRARGT